MNFISHDHSGELRHGVFYRLYFGELFRTEIGDDWYCIPGGDEDVFFVDVTDATYRRHACKFGHNYGALTSGRFDLQGDTDAPLFSCVAGFELLSDSANQALQKSGLHKLNTVKFLPESYSGYQKPIWAIHPANPFVIDRDLVIAGKAPE